MPEVTVVSAGAKPQGSVSISSDSVSQDFVEQQELCVFSDSVTLEVLPSTADRLEGEVKDSPKLSGRADWPDARNSVMTIQSLISSQMMAGSQIPLSSISNGSAQAPDEQSARKQLAVSMGFAESESERLPLCILIGTMNAGNAGINHIGQWIPPYGQIPLDMQASLGDDRIYDRFEVVAIGLQEASWDEKKAAEKADLEKTLETCIVERKQVSGNSERRLAIDQNMNIVKQRLSVLEIEVDAGRDSDDEENQTPARDSRVELRRGDSARVDSNEILEEPISPGSPKDGLPPKESSKQQSMNSATSAQQPASPSAPPRRTFVRGNKKKQTLSGRKVEQDKIIDMFGNHLGDNYELVESVRLVQMRLMVFVLKQLLPAVSNVEVGFQATGVAHVGANKGGQLIKFDIGHTSLCFFSSHLAAHQQHTKRRNEDVRDILQGCRAMDKRLDTPTQAHHSFFMGDMNYRVDPVVKYMQGALTPKKSILQSKKSVMGMKDADEKKREDMQKEHVKSLIAQQKWQELLEDDQLATEMENGRVLAGFEALVPDFAPTFKVERDRVRPNYKDQRIPSYTDRILHRSLPASWRNIKMHLFQSITEVTSSDHKPVRAVFTVLPTTQPPDVVQLGCTVELSFMRLKLLDGKSNLYLLRFSTVPDFAYKGKTQSEAVQGPDCSWIKPIKLQLQVEQVDMVHLIVECHSSTANFIGAMPMHLGDVVEAPKHFEGLNLTRNGQVIGQLSGTIQVTCPKKAAP